MRIAIIAATMTLALGTLATADPAAAAVTSHTNIPAQDLGAALRTLATERHLQILYTTATVADTHTGGAVGELTIDQALTQLLGGTNLTFLYVDADTITVVDQKEAARLKSATHAMQPASSGGGGGSPPSTSNEAPPNTDQTGASGTVASPSGSTAGQSRGLPGHLRLAQAGPENAADSAGRSSSNSDRQATMVLEEIVVTAQKREERLQDVPIPVTAINADVLAESNQLRLQDYSSTVPGFSVAPVTAAGNEQVLTIRGIGTGLGTNPTVGVTIDDVPFGSSTFTGGSATVPDLDPSDLQRIEVLRGPQGTLYGASSMGGLVKFVTADPSTAAFSGRLEGGISDTAYADAAGYNARGSVNVPLADTIALRASAFARKDPGYIDNPVYTLRGVNEDRAYGGHLAFLWKPSEEVSLKLSALYQRVKADSSNNADVPNPDYPQTAGLAARQQIDLPGYGGYESKVQAYSATLNAKLGSVDLTSVSGYNINTTFSAADLGYIFQTPSAVFVYGESRKFMQEVRLSSSMGEHLEWLAGVFYTHESAPSTGNYFLVDPASLQNAGALFDQTANGTYTEYAGFADLTVHVTDRFSVQIGGRESWIKESFGQVLDTPSLPPSISPDLTIKNNAFTYLVTPQLKISPDFMVYARLASGYRAGGPNNSPGVPLLSFKPDKTLNYELGTKADFYDHLLSIDASAYYIDWRDIQLNLVDTRTLFTYTGNAGKAKSQGMELSVEARPASGTRLAGWVSWNDATLSDPLPLDSFVLGGAYGASGDRLPYAAKWSANVSANQDFRLAPRWTASIGGNLSYVGDRLGEFPTPPASTLAPPAVPPIPPRQAFGGYATVNIHAGVRHDSWAGNLFVTNAFNRQATLAGGLGGFPPYAFTYMQPRVVGLSLMRQF